MLLRLAIGWHFTSEGVKHHQDANWSSEGFLRAAKGPLAAQYRSKLPDDYGWDALMQGREMSDVAPREAAESKPATKSSESPTPTTPQSEAAERASAVGAEGDLEKTPVDPQEKPAEAASAPASESIPASDFKSATGAASRAESFDAAFKKFQALFDGFGKLSPEQQQEARQVFAWLQRIGGAWERYARQFESFYRLSDEEKTKTQAILERRSRELTEWAASNLEALSKHGHEAARWAKAANAPTADTVPYQKKRIAENQARLSAEASVWLAAWRGIETEFRNDLREHLSAAQLASAEFPPDQSELRKVDQFMKHLILGVGLCLVAGLFTRVACIAGAAFLLSVALSQPFWIAGAQPTYNQIVEMLAMIALATTPVGRWGGLDFFIHSTFFGKCCSRAKGN